MVLIIQYFFNLICNFIISKKKNVFSNKYKYCIFAATMYVVYLRYFKINIY